MKRVFSPEDESFHWKDFSHLPKVGELFFDLAEILADEPVSHELDASLTGKKDANGKLIEMALPAGFNVDPVKLLLRIAKVKNYRANRLAISRDNVIEVSRLSGASANAISAIQTAPLPEHAERLRAVYRLIHQKAGESYLDAVDPEYSKRNGHILEAYVSLGKTLTANDFYTYRPKKR